MSEATNTQLNWLVAKCEGATDFASDGITLGFKLGGAWKVLAKGWAQSMSYHPTTDWSQMGPIIEREGINTSVNYQDDALGEVMHRVGWKADMWNNSVPGTSGFLKRAYGDTLLVAAARVYVMAKLGEAVEVPEELA